MLSLKEAAGKTGLQYPISVRSLAVSKKISGDISLRQLISTSYIDAYWYQLGDTGSKLGRPMTEALAGSDNSFGRLYRGGEIQLFSGTVGPTATARYRTQVYFNKIRCIKESGEWSKQDEPYGVILVYAPETNSLMGLKKIPDAGGDHYSVDAGNDYYEGTELVWAGPPTPIKIVCVLMESDQGDADKIKEKIQEKLLEIAKAGIASLGYGDMALLGGGFADDALKYVTLGMSELVVAVLGLGDEKIGYTVYPQDKPYIEYVELVDPELHQGHRFQFSVKVGNDNEGIYELYFEIVTDTFSKIIGPGA